MKGERKALLDKIDELCTKLDSIIQDTILNIEINALISHTDLKDTKHSPEEGARLECILEMHSIGYDMDIIFRRIVSGSKRWFMIEFTSEHSIHIIEKSINIIDDTVKLTADETKYTLWILSELKLRFRNSLQSAYQPRFAPFVSPCIT
jgi:hypothetical protein